MTFPTATPIRLAHPVAASDITLSTHELGKGPTVVLCHGFPDLAFGWRHQLPALAAAGFRAVAPDLRGYGASSAPHPVEAYGVDALTGDVVGLLDALEVERAVLVGHDWGGFVAWAAAVLHPERVAGVVGVCTPYMRFPTVAEHLAVVEGDALRQYVAWFQDDGVAEAEMDQQVDTILTRIFRTGTPMELQAQRAFADGRLNMNPFYDPGSWPILGEPITTDAELDRYVAAYRASGFRGGINWYRNIDRNAAAHPAIGVQPIEVPCLMVTAELDPGLRPHFADAMAPLVPDLVRHDVAGVGHWVHQEAPGVVNALLVDWLVERFR